MKVSLIGSGWLGQPLAKQLQTDGHQVILTTTQPDKVSSLQAKGLTALQYELGDQLSEPSNLFDADVMIIAITSKDTEAFDVLLDQLTDHNCQHLIYISSTSVYKNNNQTHDESSEQLNLDNPTYQIEQIIQTHPSASIIRFAGLVGPDRHPGKFFVGDKALNDPNAPVNLIHLDDCIGIIKAVIENKAWKQTFNGCADTHPSKLAFYRHASALLNAPEPKIQDSTSGCNKTIDNQKVKSKLSYQFIFPDVMDMTF